MGGCFSCGNRTELVRPSTEHPKEPVRDQTGTTPSTSGDFWTTSARDMDYGAMHSQRSISSISTSTQPLDAQAGVGSSNPTSEFVNHGLLLWNQTRQQWTGTNKPAKMGRQPREPKLSMVESFYPCSWDATYESLLGSNKPFAQPIPLAEMVDFLVDIWEQEGMYD